jgi:hypothetical protein
MIRVPRRFGLILTGIAGIFGVRTPPEPEVIAEMQPARPRAAPDPNVDWVMERSARRTEASPGAGKPDAGREDAEGTG